jgi:hypothetical protein
MICWKIIMGLTICSILELFDVVPSYVSRSEAKTMFSIIANAQVCVNGETIVMFVIFLNCSVSWFFA